MREVGVCVRPGRDEAQGCVGGACPAVCGPSSLAGHRGWGLGGTLGVGGSASSGASGC